MRRWVTLYTDAGWKEGRGQCGFIARGSVGPIWLTDSGGVNCDSSITAEAVAVLFGLRRVVAEFGPELPEGLEGVFLRSDCLGVVQRLRRDGVDLDGAKGDFRRALEGIKTFLEEHNLTLWAKHVRGHGKENDRVRRWMNRRADRLGNMRGQE